MELLTLANVEAPKTLRDISPQDHLETCQEYIVMDLIERSNEPLDQIWDQFSLSVKAFSEMLNHFLQKYFLPIYETEEFHATLVALYMYILSILSNVNNKSISS